MQPSASQARYRLICFGDQWDGRWRRRQQLAYRLARYPGVEDVAYVELPLSLTSLLRLVLRSADAEATTRWRRLREMGMSPRLDGVQVLTPICPLPPFRRTRWRAINEGLQEWWERRLIGGHLRSAARSSVPIVLWISHPFAANQVGKWAEALVVYDCTERFDEFNQWKPIKEEIQARDRALAARADLVLTQTAPHFEEKRKINPNTYLVPNAVDYDLFAAPRSDADLSDIRNLRRPIVAYVGNVNDRLDYDLLFDYMHTSSCSLVFIGPVTELPGVARLKTCANVHFLGEKPYAAMAQYLRFADVCLIPFLTRGVTESQSPIKLYDYLASGKPIVATAVKGVASFSQVVSIAQDRDDFARRIALALQESNPALAHQRRELAKENSWDARARTVHSLVTKRLAAGGRKSSRPEARETARVL